MHWLRNLLFRKHANDDLAEEIREHMAERTAALIEQGRNPEEAEREARRAFGNITLARERSVEVWQSRWLENLWADLRYAVRQLLRTPGFTSVALLIMSFGIGGSTAIFSVVDSVLLRPYAFHDPDQLVVWREVIQDENQQNIPVPDNYRHYVYLKAHSKTIADAAILRNTAFLVASNGEHPQIRKGLRISPNFFSILGISPFLGRNFLAEEGQAGRNNVVLISWSTWQELFFHDAGVVGRILKVNGKEQTIVGVLPKDFEFPNLNEMPGGTSSNERSPYQIFQPFIAQGDDLTADDADFAFLVLARLRSGATIREANSELGGMLGAFALANHLSMHPGVAVAPFSQEVTGNIRNALWLLLAAVLGMLLIASVNLASLQVARALVRDRDNALRAALGAGRVRLLQATFMESLCLSVIGGVTGILLALAGIRVFVAIAPENLPRLHHIHLSWQVMLFACGVSVGTATLSGIFPALHSFRMEPQRALQAGSARLTHTGQAASARRALITIEIACTAVLLVVTGLVVRSFSRGSTSIATSRRTA